MNQGSAEFESFLSNIDAGRDVITNHSHLFIAMADGQCMRWSFSANADPCGTVCIDGSTDLVFTKTSDVRLGHIHSMHASPYGSFLTMTRSSQPPTYTSSLRLPKAIYIHRCNTDVVVFPIQVAANTAYFIIPWNGCAALELYSTCQRSVSYWRDTLLAIWSLVSQTSLPLEHSFRGLQVSHVALSTLHHFFLIKISDHVCSAHRLPSLSFPIRRSTHVHPQVGTAVLLYVLARLTATFPIAVFSICALLRLLVPPLPSHRLAVRFSMC